MMKLDELQREAERLSPEEQRKLIGFLVTIASAAFISAIELAGNTPNSPKQPMAQARKTHKG